MIRHRTLQAYITQHRTYVIHCPNCNRAQAFRIADIPPDRPSPFQHECSCGIPSMVHLVGFRASERKRVKLTGSFVRVADSRNCPMTCRVLDISVKGLRLTTTEPVKNLSRAEILKIAVILDDRRRTHLDLFAKIRRVTPAKTHLTIAVEFLPLDHRHRTALESYLRI